MNDMSNVSKVVTDVEKDLLDEIVVHLKKNQLDAQKAQGMAQEFLSLLPPQDFPGMVSVLKGLSQKYDEARIVYIKYEGIQQKLNDISKVNMMAQHISEGNIEKAIDVAKGEQNA
jgi:hypothetical protein